jgi:hypothetical protein
LGIAGGANFPAPAPAAGACPVSPSSAGGARFDREMICVYGLGPLGASTGTGVGSAVGCLNAPVAPSPDKELGRCGRGLSAGTFGDGGIAGVGRFGIATGTGGDAAKTGSGTGGVFIGCTVGRG